MSTCTLSASLNQLKYQWSEQQHLIGNKGPDNNFTIILEIDLVSQNFYQFKTYFQHNDREINIVAISSQETQKTNFRIHVGDNQHYLTTQLRTRVRNIKIDTKK